MMNKYQLIIIAGCATVIVNALATEPMLASPVQMPSDSSQTTSPKSPLANQSLSGEDNLSTPTSYQKRLEIAAMSRFGCSCGNCVGIIRQLVREGSISI